MSSIKFVATKLSGTGKRGILKPDTDGYYTLPIGGLNTFNSVGEYYTADGARELFERSSVFMRRVTNGRLKSESGHPKRLPGWTDDDYLRRIMIIEETNVCCHISEVWLDDQFGRNNPQFKNPSLVAIMGKIKPAGPRGESLKASLDNPNEDVCFSIRALTRDYYNRGQTYRVLNQIFTFDNVVEPGLPLASKYSSPALESFHEEFVMKRQFERIAASVGDGIAIEDSKIMAIETLKVFEDRIVTLPHLYAKW